MANRMIAAALACALALSGAAGGFAQENGGCDGFKWSLARERAWFAGPAEQVGPGATIALERAYAARLAPTAEAGFRAPPERAPKPDRFGAALEVAKVDTPGLYQITLSDEAWIDVLQNGAPVKSTAFSGQKNCPGVRKSVRFDLKTGPLVVQISNAASAAIELAIATAQ